MPTSITSPNQYGPGRPIFTPFTWQRLRAIAEQDGHIIDIVVVPEELKLDEPPTLIQPETARFLLSELSAHLTCRQVEYLAPLDIKTAFKYSGHLLSDEAISRLAWQDPAAALRYAADRLNPASIVLLSESCPDLAVLYASHLLPAWKVDFFATEYPALALRMAPRLHRTWRKECALREPAAALQHAVAFLEEDTFNSCVERAPGAALKYTYNLLSDTQFGQCLSALSDEALLEVHHYLRKEVISFWHVDMPALFQADGDVIDEVRRRGLLMFERKDEQ